MNNIEIIGDGPIDNSNQEVVIYDDYPYMIGDTRDPRLRGLYDKDAPFVLVKRRDKIGTKTYTVASRTDVGRKVEKFELLGRFATFELAMRQLKRIRNRVELIGR